MIRAAIFDLNGVFIQSPKLSDRFKTDFGIGEDTFLPVLKEILAIVRMPDAGDSFQYWKPYLEKWHVSLGREEFYDYWFRAEKENTELTELAAALKEKGYKLIILSNNFKERAQFYQQKFPFIHVLFDGVYYSWQTGYVKPDERAFDLIFREHNIKPSECVFYDDSEANVTLASNLGIEAYIYENADQIRQRLL